MFICLVGFCAGLSSRKSVCMPFRVFYRRCYLPESTALPEKTRQVISQMVYAIFVPLFFASIALRIDFFQSFDLFLVLFVATIGIAGKFLGAWLGVTFTNLPKVNRLSVAIAHTPGGSVEIVVGMLALQYNLISQSMFVAIVCGGIISSMLIGPWFKYSITRRKAVGILEFFSQREIVVDIKATDRDNVIRELCTVAVENGNVPSLDRLITAVIGRENTMGTAIEYGVALPHARIPLLIRPVIIFGKSELGIDWNSPDGGASHFIFLILTPKEDDDIQIQILRIIAKAMSEEEVRKALWGDGSTGHLADIATH